jgi:hypothetical protein
MQDMPVQLTVSIPDELLAQFQLLAAREYRSVESHLLWVMKKAVQNSTRPPRRQETYQERQHRNEAVLRELQKLHLLRGKPSTRAIAVATRERGTPVGHSTIHSALTGTGVMSWPVLEKLVIALGGDIRRFKEIWMAANE